MKHLAVVLAVLAGLSSAQAQEKKIPEGVLVRVDAKGNREVFREDLGQKELSKTEIQALAEKIATPENALTVKEVAGEAELDQTTSSEAWYWYSYYNVGYYPYYNNYYGYYYNNYYYNYYPSYYWTGYYNYSPYSYYYYYRRW